MSDHIGDIKLDGVDYRIILESSQELDITDFAPRAATPGGSIIHSELGLIQPLLQSRWDHGFGHPWYDDEAGYLRTTGNVDTRHSGVAMLFTQSTSSSTSIGTIEGYTTWNGVAWAWGDGGLYKYSGGSWANVYSANAVNHALGLGSYLFYCPDGARIRKVDTGDTHTNAGAGANSTDYAQLEVHAGYVYALKDDTNQIYYDDSDDLSGLEGDPDDDTNEIYVGAGAVPVTRLYPSFSKLFAMREDGVFEVGSDNIARRVLNYTAERDSANFRGAAEHVGFLLFPVRDKLLQWNTARINDVTPPRISDSFPYVTYGRFDNLTQFNDYLFLSARTNESTYTESILCYDGVSWFRLHDAITDGDGSVTGMGYDPVNNYLWYHVEKPSAGTDTTYYIEFQDQSDFPFANFPTTGTHSLISSRLDMGFRRVKKSTQSLLVEGSNLDNGTYLSIYYALDGGSWKHWDDVKTNGVVELKGPGGNRTVEYNYINIRVDFVTDDTAQSPILEGLTLRFIMRPDVEFGFSHDILVASNLEMGRRVSQDSAADIMQRLRDLRDSKEPVEYTDIEGGSHYVYISSMSTRALEKHLRKIDAFSNIERVAHVNLVAPKLAGE